MDITQKLAQWADQIRSIAANGLTYVENIYDRDRYEQLQKLAVEMYAEITANSRHEITPLIAPLLNHPTPVTAADAAIVDKQGLILLIRRADNERWALPGGFLEIGETPAQGAVREAKEETGVLSRAVRLVGIYDSRLCGAIALQQMYLFTFLCEPTGASEEITHGHEVLESAWFKENEVPSDLSPGHQIRIPHTYKVLRGESISHVDL